MKETNRRSFLLTVGAIMLAAGTSELEAQTEKLVRPQEVSMTPGAKRGIEQLNVTHYRPGQQVGHYETFFQRANHPRRPLAFWIRVLLQKQNEFR